MSYGFIVRDSQGERYCVWPGNVIPIEYYRTNSLVANVFLRGDDATKQALCDALLDLLNGGCPSRFDEMLPLVRPRSGRKFVGLDLVLIPMDLSVPGPCRRLTPESAALTLYSFARPDV